MPAERRRASPKSVRIESAPVKPPFAADTGTLGRSAGLLFALVGAAFAVRMHATPLFGRAFGPMWFYFGAFISILGGTVLVGEDSRSQGTALLAAALLQTTSVLGGRAASAFAAASVNNPVAAAALAHAFVSYPMLGMAGAVWLEWAVRFISWRLD